MKKIYTFLIATMFGISGMVAQNVIFSDDFETAGFPTGYTMYDVDGNTVSSSISSFFPNAWNRLRFTGDPNWFVASTSWYSPAGTANDWLITPPLTLTNKNYLFFKMRSGNAGAPDGFEVKISTTNNNMNSFTTNLLTVASQSTNWTLYAINLSAYANQTVYIAWRNNATDGYILALDEILVSEVLNGDSQMDEITVADKVIQNSNVNVTGILSHRGSDTLNSINVNWRVNGGTINTMAITGLNLTYGQTYSFTHNVPYTPANVGGYDNLEVWVSNPNGMGSTNTTNDTLQKNVFVSSGTGVQRNVLFEEFTTAGCQFCPDGHVVMATILAQNPNVIPVSIHSCFGSDAMTNPDASTICSTLGNNSAPTGMVDRIQHEGDAEPAHSRSLWQSRVDDRSLVPSEASVNTSGTYDNTSRAVSIDVDVSFVDYVMSGDIRLSLMIIEDSVSGSGTGWNQINYYNTVPGHPMQGRGNPILNYQHRHVLRDILPSTWGDATVIPNTPTIDSTYSKNFSFTLDNSYNADKVSFVAVISYKGLMTDGYEVINANEVHLSSNIIDEGLDIAVTGLNIPAAVLDGDSVEIKATIRNVDADTLNSFDLNWSVDNGTVHTASYSNLNLAFADELEFIHSEKAELVGLNSLKNVKVWITNINGGSDVYVLNNSREQMVKVTVPKDAALAELSFDNIIGGGQNLIVSGEIANVGVDTLNSVDVNWTVNGGTVNTETLNNLNLAHGQSITFNHSVVWVASGLGTTNNFNVWIDQSNGSAEVITNNDTLNLDVKVASTLDLELEQVHFNDTLIKGETVEIKGRVKNVGVENVNSFVIGWSVNGGTINKDTIDNVSIPNNISYNFIHQYTYTAPSTLGGGTIDVYVDGVNSTGSQITTNDTISIAFVTIVGLNEIPTLVDRVNIYPNPTSDRTNLDLTLDQSTKLGVTIFDLTGKIVYQNNYGIMNNGNHTLPINISSLTDGLYIVKVQAGEQVLSKKISIIR